jgi:hypothetical protein
MTDTKSLGALISLVVGVGILAFGIVGLIGSTSIHNARTIITWVIGADLLHDLIVAPAVCAVGLGLTRIVPNVGRTAIRSAAVASAAVLVVSYPLLRAFGRHHVPDNRSALPLDYPTAVATVLGVVWGIAIIWGCANWWRSRPVPKPDVPPADNR